MKLKFKTPNRGDRNNSLNRLVKDTKLTLTEFSQLVEAVIEGLVADGNLYIDEEKIGYIDMERLTEDRG